MRGGTQRLRGRRGDRERKQRSRRIVLAVPLVNGWHAVSHCALARAVGTGVMAGWALCSDAAFDERGDGSKEHANFKDLHLALI